MTFMFSCIVDRLYQMILRILLKQHYKLTHYKICGSSGANTGDSPRGELCDDFNGVRCVLPIFINAPLCARKVC